MTKAILAIVLAFTVGVLCRLFEVPLPAPPKLLGAMLILTTTIGYMLADAMLVRRAARNAGALVSIEEQQRH